MKKTKKRSRIGKILLTSVLCASMIVGGSFAFAGCSAEDIDIYGKSAYEIAVENGFTGTEEEWLNGMKGADGQDGETPYIGENGNWYCNGQDTGKKATGSGSNVVLSPTPPAEPYDGLIWCQVESDNDSAFLNVAALSVVESASEPASPVNGTIWIETQA